MADTVKRLAGPAVGTGADASIYTVPALTTAIIRSIHVCNTTGGDLAFKMSIGADAAGTRIFNAQNVPANDVIDWSGVMVMNAAEVLHWNGPAGLTVTVNGIESA